MSRRSLPSHLLHLLHSSPSLHQDLPRPASRHRLVLCSGWALGRHAKRLNRLKMANSRAAAAWSCLNVPIERCATCYVHWLRQLRPGLIYRIRLQRHAVMALLLHGRRVSIQFVGRAPRATEDIAKLCRFVVESKRAFARAEAT